MARNALIVFVKEPVPGTVKTRLTPDLTPEQAALLYSAFIQDSYSIYRSITPMVDLRYYFAPTANQLSALLPSQSEWFPQLGDDLGERMHRAFEETLSSYQTAVIVGSDHPNLPLSYLDKAFKVLNYVDTVIGPSDDGGYYCLGLKRSNPSLFENMTWSVNSVYSETKRRMATQGMEVFELPSWYDIDHFADLKRFIVDSDLKSFPAIDSALKSIGLI